MVMTATPIPRTLAMTLYGDLDVSVIDEVPPADSLSKRYIIGQHKGKKCIFIRKQIKAGRQIYIVYPLIHKSEKLDYENLKRDIRNCYSISGTVVLVAVVHGQQKPEDKA